MRLLSSSNSFRGALLILSDKNDIEPGANVLKDQVMSILIMWMSFNWIAQLNCVKQFLLEQTVKYLTLYNIFVWYKQTNAKNLKSGSNYETKIKTSYETSSSMNNYTQKPLEVFYKERCS